MYELGRSTHIDGIQIELLSPFHPGLDSTLLLGMGRIISILIGQHEKWFLQAIIHFPPISGRRHCFTSSERNIQKSTRKEECMYIGRICRWLTWCASAFLYGPFVQCMAKTLISTDNSRKLRKSKNRTVCIWHLCVTALIPRHRPGICYNDFTEFFSFPKLERGPHSQKMSSFENLCSFEGAEWLQFMDTFEPFHLFLIC